MTSYNRLPSWNCETHTNRSRSKLILRISASIVQSFIKFGLPIVPLKAKKKRNKIGRHLEAVQKSKQLQYTYSMLALRISANLVQLFIGFGPPVFQKRTKHNRETNRNWDKSCFSLTEYLNLIGNLRTICNYGLALFSTWFSI